MDGEKISSKDTFIRKNIFFVLLSLGAAYGLYNFYNEKMTSPEQDASYILIILLSLLMIFGIYNFFRAQRFVIDEVYAFSKYLVLKNKNQDYQIYYHQIDHMDYTFNRNSVTVKTTLKDGNGFKKYFEFFCKNVDIAQDILKKYKANNINTDD